MRATLEAPSSDDAATVEDDHRPHVFEPGTRPVALALRSGDSGGRAIDIALRSHRTPLLALREPRTVGAKECSAAGQVENRPEDPRLRVELTIDPQEAPARA